MPGSVFADADVYQLNNGSAISAGTKMRVTIKTSQTGSNLGSSVFVGRFDSSLQLPTDYSGSVAFGLFETTGLSNVSDADIADAKLIFSPSDFQPFSAGGAKVIADNGTTKYGYDSNGDYYVEFTPPAGYAISPADRGADDAADSDASPLGTTAVTTIALGEADPSWDAGLYLPVSLGNLVWNDINNNGLAESGEPLIGGVLVNLYRDANANGRIDAGERNPNNPADDVPATPDDDVVVIDRKADSFRRSVYLPMFRNALPEALEVFDFDRIC